MSLALTMIESIAIISAIVALVFARSTAVACRSAATACRSAATEAREASAAALSAAVAARSAASDARRAISICAELDSISRLDKYSVREALNSPGGAGKIVEADETELARSRKTKRPAGFRRSTQFGRTD